MTNLQIYGAIRKVVELTVELEADGYQPVSARSALRKLGYDREQQDSVILFIADGGFDYCLDPTIPMTGHHEAAGETPHPDVCYWGPDQLRSRLFCLSNLPYFVLSTHLR